MSLPRPRAILFDLDGTLVDSLADIAAATNHALAAAGLPTHSLAAIRGFIGEGLPRLVAQAAPQLAGEPLAALTAAVRARYVAVPVEATAPYPGIPALLAALTAADVPLAILSNKPHPLTLAVTARLFADVPFRAVWGDAPAERRRKPDPAGALALAAQLGADPAGSWFVGDTAVDMQTATAAGMVPVGVAWGFRPREELVAHGAAAVVADAGALQRLALGAP